MTHKCSEWPTKGVAVAVMAISRLDTHAQSRAQTLPSHEERGLVTVERFLGSAESTVLILDKSTK